MKNKTAIQTLMQPVHKSIAKNKRENVAQNYTNLAIILKYRESCPSPKLQINATTINLF